MKATWVIADRAALLALPRLLFRARPARLRLDLPGLDAQARATAEARLAQGLSACGCNEGALALVLTLPVALGWGWHQAPGIGRWLTGAGLLVAAAAVGKGLGLLRARAALRHEIQRVLAQADGTDPFPRGVTGGRTDRRVGAALTWLQQLGTPTRTRPRPPSQAPR